MAAHLESLPHIEFLRDERGGVTLELDGYPQSYVDLTDPGLLGFEYVQHLAMAIDGMPQGRLRVTHVGGGALTLPRYVHHTRPGSPQIVLEPDAALTEQVRRELPLPRGHRIRVRPLDGLTGMAQLRDQSADVVVIDAYVRGQVPAELVGSRFLTDVGRVLTRDGLLLVNLADEPGLGYVHRVAASIAPLVAQLAAVAPVQIFKGRRYGNTVLIGSRAPLARLDLSRRLTRLPLPTTMLGPAELARRVRGAKAFGPEGQTTPPPPAPGSWRLV